MTGNSTLSQSIINWAVDPNGGGGIGNWRVKHRNKILSHNPTCASLDYIWLPREGGVSCPSDLFWCEDCDVCFFNEGAYVEETEDFSFWRCECCNRKIRSED